MGIESFDQETMPDLVGFSCDEADGPITVAFDRALVDERIEIAALRDRRAPRSLGPFLGGNPSLRKGRQAIDWPKEG